jgi:hypothetical protein
MVNISTSGSFDKTEKFLAFIRKGDFYKALDSAARRGVSALAAATPVESGLTAASWGYEIRQSLGSVTITWTNTNINDGVSVAIILQYGHGTGTGGYVQGRDYINPAIRPVFDEIADNVWRAVTSA